MSTYTEAVMHTEDQLAAEAKRDEAIHQSVCAALNRLDLDYPEFRKSPGPFGDKLAGELHKCFERAFDELRKVEEKEVAELDRLSRKYGRPA